MEAPQTVLLTLILLVILSFVFYYFASTDTLNRKDVTIKNLEKEKESLEASVDKFKSEREYMMLLLKNASDSKEFQLRNPTWKELKAFLELDNTNKIVYNGSFDCTGFALELYKRARNNGLHAGLVEVNYGDNVTGHMLNVFETVDKGLIFIDDTGNENGTSSDNIAYIEIGKPYGTVIVGGVKERLVLCDISCSKFAKEIAYTNYTNLFDYSYFTKFKECKNFYEGCIGEYSNAVDDFNRGSKKYTYSQLQKWYDNLDVLAAQLVSGEFYVFSESSVVKNVEIYW